MITKVKGAQSAQGSFPFLEILTLIFITLKLTNYIAWSWWWVLAPVWMPIMLVLSIAFLFVALGGK